MPDDIDRIVEREQFLLDRRIAIARAPIPVGAPGICDGCEERMSRLVNGLCGYCRDGR